MFGLILTELNSKFGLLGNVRTFDVRFLGDKPKLGTFKAQFLVKLRSLAFLGSFHPYYKLDENQHIWKKESRKSNTWDLTRGRGSKVLQPSVDLN